MATGGKSRRGGRRGHNYDSDEVRLSKALSSILRHKFQEFGLTAYPGGYIDLDAILSLPKFRGYTEEMVREVVQSNEKQRFSLRNSESTGKLQIRANQGHTVEKSFKIEIEETDTIQVLKEKIALSQGEEEYPVSYQKLLYKGKILANTSLISDTEITDTGFIVVMVSKPKQVPVPETPQQTTVPLSNPTTLSTDTPAPPLSTAPTTLNTEQGATAPVGSTQDTSQAMNAAVDSIMSMSLGYSRAEVRQAVVICNNNVEEAANLLMSGEGPGPLTQEVSHMTNPTLPAPAQQSPLSSQVAGGTTGGTANTRSNVSPEILAQQLQQPTSGLEFLRSQPQFQELRDLIRSRPETLTDILEQINQSNPLLYQLISSNPDEFRRLIHDDTMAPIPPSGTSPSLGGTQPSVTVPPGGGPPQIAVNTEEMAAINRLKSMGFQENMVIQAYFACDKNEELAANFLLGENQNDL